MFQQTFVLGLQLLLESSDFVLEVDQQLVGVCHGVDIFAVAFVVVGRGFAYLSFERLDFLFLFLHNLLGQH